MNNPFRNGDPSMTVISLRVDVEVPLSITTAENPQQTLETHFRELIMDVLLKEYEKMNFLATEQVCMSWQVGGISNVP